MKITIKESAKLIDVYSVYAVLMFDHIHYISYITMLVHLMLSSSNGCLTPALPVATRANLVKP